MFPAQSNHQSCRGRTIQKFPFVFATMAAAILPASVAYAEDSDDADWEVRVAPYVWGASLEGNVQAFPSAPSVPVDLTFGDIFNKLDFAFMLAVEARRDKLYLKSDSSYVSLSAPAPAPVPDFDEADVSSKTFQTMLAVGHTVIDTEDLRGDVFAGGRLWSIKSDLTLRADDNVVNTKSTETFVNPVLGASAGLVLSEELTLDLTGTVGGFGIGAESEFGVLGAVEWQPGDSWGVAAGYRYLAVDYEDDGFVFDVEQHGPFVSAFLEF